MWIELPAREQERTSNTSRARATRAVPRPPAAPACTQLPTPPRFCVLALLATPTPSQYPTAALLTISAHPLRAWVAPVLSWHGRRPPTRQPSPSTNEKSNDTSARRPSTLSLASILPAATHLAPGGRPPRSPPRPRPRAAIVTSAAGARVPGTAWPRLVQIGDGERRQAGGREARAAGRGQAGARARDGGSFHSHAALVCTTASHACRSALNPRTFRQSRAFEAGGGGGAVRMAGMSHA
eukprot:162858-Chlamydomonas_euryale.AAC.3